MESRPAFRGVPSEFQRLCRQLGSPATMQALAREPYRFCQGSCFRAPFLVQNRNLAALNQFQLMNSELKWLSAAGNNSTPEYQENGVWLIPVARLPPTEHAYGGRD